jgi:pimeloyl-ACP methyl ester carboxylesterase
MPQLAHQFVRTNGIKMHYVEAGTGPVVLLCHGFPESWYSWRHQITALADAGFHVVAPDLRGYGQTDRPQDVEAYDIFQLTGDLVGLVNSLHSAPVVIAGHDRGAELVGRAALLRADLFSAVILLSVPFLPRWPIIPSEWERRKYPGKIFYRQVFVAPGSEKLFETDVRGRLTHAFNTLSGETQPELRWKYVIDPKDAEAVGNIPPVLKKPSWLTEEDLNFFIAEFTRTGFSGGLNYYRNDDRNWSLTPFLEGARLLQPTLFVAGEADAVIEFWKDEFDAMEVNVPSLWKKIVLPGVGHWIPTGASQRGEPLDDRFLKKPLVNRSG